jgi:hypothetical protein
MKRIFFLIFWTAWISFPVQFQLQGTEEPVISEIDRIRLSEAFRLAESLDGKLWKEWGRTPFAILLVTPDQEFLIRHPAPSSDFQSLGEDDLLGSNVFFRKRTQPLHLLATFPLVGGIPTIVIGQAENTTVKTSSKWVVTLLHEHFHQLQMSQPSYFKDVEALDLSGGDETGMWMLNFPFPYESTPVIAQIHALSQKLHDAVLKRNPGNYFEERKKLKSILKPKDYAYLSFQIWQEGISRYTEYKAAEWAEKEFKPSAAFLSLKDYEDFGTVAAVILREKILYHLKDVDIARDRREFFYSFGAAEGLLLDQVNPTWREKYLTEKFYVESYVN